MSIGERINLDWIFIAGGEISRIIYPKTSGVENINVRIPIDSWGPFATKDRAVGGVDVIFKGIGKQAEITLAIIHTILNPEISMLSGVTQSGIHTSITHFIISHPKRFLGAQGNIVGRRG